MGQPVKLSDELVVEARIVGEVAERSIAGQIELWAAIGKAVEPVMRTDAALALRRRGAARPLSECLNDVGTKKGRERLAETLRERPFPHYQPAPGKPGWLMRIDEDGTRTVGRFVKRKFVPA